MVMHADRQTEARLVRPPGPSEQFDIGDTDDSLDKMVVYFREYGDIFRIYSPSRGTDTYVINHPDWVKRVLVTNHRNYTKGVGINRVKVLLGNGIMVSEGDFWRRQRRMIQPFFHKRAIQHFYQNMLQCSRELLEHWTAEADSGRRINVTESVSDMTLQVVLRSIFSDDLKQLAHDAGGNPFAIVSEESARDLRFAAKFRALAKPILALVACRRQQNLQRVDLLSMLMGARDKRTGEAMTDKALIDEVMTLIVAGHETTASALNWLWYLVSQHPHVETRLQREVDGLGDDPEPEAILAAHYVRHVIDEVLRLYPPGWLITRRAIAQDQFGDYRVLPGTDIFISPYLLHRHRGYWEDPETFRPERFRDANVKERYRFVYLPFVAGPRHCVGETFALVEMQFHVALVAQRFALRLAPVQRVELEPRVNLRTAKPLHYEAVLRGK